MSVARLRLPERLESALLLGHPWVYRDQIPRRFAAKRGSFVNVRCGRFEGWALWDADSAIALRIYSREREPDVAFFEARVREAWQLRASLLESDTDAFRWVYGEADGLPGIVVDYYAGFAVIVCDCVAVVAIAKSLVSVLREVAPLKAVVFRRREAAASERLEVLWGQAVPEKLTVQEYGLKLLVDLAAGQKTGLFLDHRDNRAHVELLCEGRRVLNLFAYNGAFSLAALRGGATSVVSVDVAPQAARDALANVELNGLDPSRHEFVVADVFEYLERGRVDKQQFDLIICDPPSFARSNAHVDKALKAYTRVNAAAMKLSASGGLYAAASCTGRVTPEAFKVSLAQSARRAQRRLQIVAESGQPLDHPVLASHPEGRYLKFVLGRVLPRA
jgi:23S rRNA (cytosine1962-C5)-methyltransferase